MNHREALEQIAALRGHGLAIVGQKALAIADEALKHDGWLPIETAPFNTRVLCAVDHGKGVAVLIAGQWECDETTVWIDDANQDYVRGVIAWQPLPEPPKK